MLIQKPLVFRFFFFNDTATTEIYTLSLHDALPISTRGRDGPRENRRRNGGSVQSLDLDDSVPADPRRNDRNRDRKSTRLNSSHSQISYAVFCLKKKNERPSPSAPSSASTSLGNICS